MADNTTTSVKGKKILGSASFCFGPCQNRLLERAGINRDLPDERNLSEQDPSLVLTATCRMKPILTEQGPPLTQVVLTDFLELADELP